MNVMARALRIIITVFVLVALLLLAISLTLYFVTADYLKEAKLTTAVITRIDRQYDAFNDEYEYVPYISYTANEHNYTNVRVNFYSSSMRENDEIEIYYLPSDPTEIRHKGTIHLATIITGSIGGFFGIVAIIIAAVRHKSKSNKEYLYMYGREYTATITEVFLNTNVTVNGLFPHVIICTMPDDRGGTRQFRSENLWYNPEPLLDGNTITVLIDPNNPNNYLVDTRELEKAANL